ncbi:MAG: isoprenylcysteine carboxylmethyltransferase family protein [Alphaproteobacteria bacterium]|nr:isoprenylcysteine carboxylmethyltransferase family protein [Alphaproteobacteria bacterium]
MAKNLNKSRILASKAALISTLLIVLFSRQYWQDDSAYHEVLELVGNFLIAICAMGRVYATAFLGGFKNDRLVTHGIYSLMRNPLYFFSLIGITGVALVSNHLVVMIGLPMFFLLIYLQLIAREESFLLEKFGAAFTDYMQRVPALWPRFSNYNAPQTTELTPRFLNKAFADAVWWLAALPVIELVEYLQTAGWVPTFFTS